MPTEVPTGQPTIEPTLAIPTPTKRPTLTNTPTTAPTQEPSPTIEPTLAPGHAKTRSADGMVMVYVPGGTFQMGSSEAEIDAAFAQCEQNLGSFCERLGLLSGAFGYLLDGIGHLLTSLTGLFGGGINLLADTGYLDRALLHLADQLVQVIDHTVDAMP